MKIHTRTGAAMAAVMSLCLIAAIEAKADVVVVVAVDSPVNTITQAEASRIFLGKVNVNPIGGPVSLVDFQAPSPLRDEFYSKITNKTPQQLAASRANLIFSGKMIPPPELTGAKEVIQTLVSNPSAMGYLDKADVNSRVKVILAP